MTLKTLIKLAEPKTFSASLLPVIYGSAFAYAHYGIFNGFYFCLLCLGMMLVQGVTNMINDYYDFKRMADQSGKADEKALASGEVTLPRLKQIIFVFVAAALGIGFYFAATINWWILAVIALAMLILTTYSTGPKPICYTPFGEVAAGLVMGMGITSTVVFIQSGVFNALIILIALPTVFFISGLLLANNLADWQEDLLAGRKTSVILLGAEKASMLWVALMLSMLLSSAALTGIGAYNVWVLAALVLTFPYRKLLLVLKAEKRREKKGLLMGTTTIVGLRYHVVLILMLLTSR
jgi:1,4-dihydroxy-2-naphthoate octaprenyltransferase